MTGAQAIDLYYDPFDFEIDDDPYPIWKRLGRKPRSTTTRNSTSTRSAASTTFPGAAELAGVPLGSRHHLGRHQERDGGTAGCHSL